MKVKSEGEFLNISFEADHMSQEYYSEIKSYLNVVCVKLERDLKHWFSCSQKGMLKLIK